MDGQVKIVWKKVKKPKEKQDMTMADVSEGGKEELAVDEESLHAEITCHSLCIL